MRIMCQDITTSQNAKLKSKNDLELTIDFIRDHSEIYFCVAKISANGPKICSLRAKVLVRFGMNSIIYEGDEDREWSVTNDVTLPGDSQGSSRKYDE